MGGAKKQTTGYRYGLGMHLGIVDGTIDAFKQIVAGGRLAWSGNLTFSGSFYVNAPNLFGGDAKEGGIRGQADVQFGEPTQERNSYLKGLFGATGPAYRKLTGLVWRGGLVTSNNPYIKPWSFRIVRILKGWDNDTPWYPEKAAIMMPNGITAMNPAHIAYQVMTSRRWGMQWPREEIEDATARAAADLFYNEGFGLCMLWTQEEQIDEFLRIVCDHVGMVIRQRPEDGKFLFKPIRGNYDISQLPVLDPSNVLAVDDFTRNGGVDAVNEVVVTYRDQVTNKDVPVSAHNLAAIQNSGAVLSDARSYPGIPEANLANRVATRDVMQSTASTALMKLTTNRIGTSLLKGDLAVLNWPPLGIEGMVLRILDNDSGQLTDGRCVLNVAEDFYGLPNASYLQPQPSTWTPPDLNPQPIQTAVTIEATYRDLCEGFTDTELGDVTAASGYLVAMAQRPAGVPLNYTLYDRVYPAGYAEAGRGDFTPNCLLATAVTRLQTSVPFTTDYDLGIVQIGTVAMIGDDPATAEQVRVDAIDLDNNRFTLARGCVDTLPKPWPAGTRIWFYNDFRAYDPTEYTAGETVDASLVTNAGTGSMDVTQGKMLSRQMNSRQIRPYPVGNLRVNGVADGALRGLLTLAWSTRNRLLQDDRIIEHTAGDVAAEAGTTYDITLYDENNVARKTVANSTVTSLTWDTEAVDSNLPTLTANWYDSAFGGLGMDDNFDSGMRKSFWTGSAWAVVGTILNGADTWAPHSGAFQMRTGPIGDGGSTTTSVTVSGPGVVTFWYRGQSEGNYDFLRVSLDGALKVQASGMNGNWQQAAITVPSGSHVIAFNYSKDGSGSTGVDCYFIDDFRFQTGAAPPRLNNHVRYTLTTKRDGYAAWQNYDTTLPRHGYGYNYGLAYGGT